KMRTEPRWFQSRGYVVPRKFPLQLQKVWDRSLVIGINRAPLGLLRLRIDRIEPNRPGTFQVVNQCLNTEGRVRARPVIVMPAARVWAPGLQRVSAPVYE